jgi:hypothetical protein
MIPAQFYRCFPQGLWDSSRSSPFTPTFELITDNFKTGSYGWYCDVGYGVSHRSSSSFLWITDHNLAPHWISCKLTGRTQIRECGALLGKILSEEGQIVKEFQSAIEKVKAQRGGGKDTNLEQQDPTVGMILAGLKKDNRNPQEKAGIQQPR